jgi:hypothetical protein
MAARLARAACLLVAAAATDECHTPSTNTYTMDPPAATYPARPLRELTTPVTAVLRWHGNDEAQLAACLGTLRATLPRARVTIAARDMERARRVGKRFEVESVVDSNTLPMLTTGQVVVADASAIFQPDATRTRIVSMKGCAAAGRAFAVGDAQSVGRWLRGGACSESTTGLVLANGCAHSNAFGEVVENELPYFALLRPSADCPWRPTLAARLQTFSAVCAKPPCTAPLSRVKNRKRTQQLLDTHGLNDKTGADAALLLRQRRPLFAVPFFNKTQTTDCLLMGAGDYKDPNVYATFLRSLREAGSACDVTLFTNDASSQHIQSIFNKYNARWHRFLPQVDGLSKDEVAKQAFQTAPGLGRKASTLRFRIFRSYLVGESRHSFVGWADVRDVFFQSCPFSHVRSGTLHVFSETALLTLAHKRRVYLEWSRRAWGFDCSDEYETYHDAPPINLGVVLGARSSVLQALDTLICSLERCGGWDQFLWSKLIYEGTIASTAHLGDDDAAVANLCANLDVEVGDASRVVSARGEPYSIVHQYDRYDGVVRAVASRWPFAAA